ncbi:MAG TPA: hypothetical protein VL172_01650 [Kofleriaceae bacterium]|nr:hypothetical protein [Kofleriaceae bacterium]
MSASGGSRGLGVVLGILVVVGFAAFVGTQAARSKLGEEDFYKQTLENNNAYDRLYDDMIADPAFAPQLDEMLGGVNVSREDLAATVKQVAKPEYVKAMADSAIKGLTAFFRGEPLVFTLDISAIVEGIHSVAVNYAINEIASKPVKQSESIEAFAQDFRAVITGLATEGAIPEYIPSFPLEAEADREQVAGILLEVAQLQPDNPDHQEVIGAIANALRADDVATAIKVSAAALLTQVITRSILQLTSNPLIHQEPAGEGKIKFVLYTPDSVNQKLESKLGLAQKAHHHAGWARIVGLLLVLFGSAGIFFIFRSNKVRALRWTGAPLIIAGLLGFIAWLIARKAVTGKVTGVIENSKGLPPSLRNILSDVSSSVVGDLTPSFWIPSFIVMGLGVAAIIASVIMARGKPTGV